MEPPHFRHRPLELLTAGFTLIELMVVLAIIGTVTGIALSSESAFNRTLVLANTAYDIALTLRSAESFGTASRALATTANVGYGVHFQRGTTGSFILFADTWPVVDPSCTRPDCRGGDYLYTTDDVIVQTYTLGNNIMVSDFCTSSDRLRCASTGDLHSLDVVFARPNPDAFIRANGSFYTDSYTAACLVISSDRGGTRSVFVEASGQIRTGSSSCL